jgi:pimeloyl-ACP methyl ester carboxylesterase
VRPLPPFEAAHSDNGLPFVRVGAGRDPLAIFTSGSPDIFYPPAMLREMAQLIPDAQKSICLGVGHGLIELRKKKFEENVLGFIAQ